MPTSPRTFALLLALTPGIGGRKLTSILAKCELLGCLPDDFLKLSRESYQEEFKLAPKSIDALFASRSSGLAEVRETEERLSGLGVRLITAVDGSFPARIEQFDPNPPGLLFAYGSLNLLERSTFSVIASRNAPKAALDKIEQLTEERLLQGAVLVGGVDRLEYQRASVVPLRWGAPRILCLDRGLYGTFGKDLKSEAFRAARLWRHSFDPSTDLALTPFRPDAHFQGVNNQVRDRLVGSLSDRIDFVHIAEGGNMEKLLRTAIKAGREVGIWACILNYRRFVELGATAFD